MIMKLNSAYLEAFYTCAQTRNFTRAAERLHITQSALSQRVINLELELSTTLFIRERSGLKLTEAGEKLLRYCQSQELLEEELLSEIKEDATSNLGGVIRIGGFSSVMRSLIFPKLVPLLTSNQGLRVKMMTKELYELQGLLKSGEIDFMILDKELQSENLVSKLLGYEENVLVSAKRCSQRDIYLDHDESDQTTVRYLRKKSSAGLKRSYFDDVYGLIDGVKQGVGVAVLPKHLIENVKGLVVINPDRVLKVPIVLHYYQQPFYTKLQRAVITALR